MRSADPDAPLAGPPRGPRRWGDPGEGHPWLARPRRGCHFHGLNAVTLAGGR
ncbi:MAG: hypothetical protein RL112_2292, partial [Planctomycetota bacterium]